MFRYKIVGNDCLSTLSTKAKFLLGLWIHFIIFYGLMIIMEYIVVVKSVVGQIIMNSEDFIIVL